MPKQSKPNKSVLSKKSVEKIPQKSRSVGKTPGEIVREHIHNKDDMITDEEFKNLKLDLGLPKDKTKKPLPISNKKNRPKDEDKDPGITTPWDVISE